MYTARDDRLGFEEGLGVDRVALGPAAQRLAGAAPHPTSSFNLPSLTPPPPTAYKPIHSTPAQVVSGLSSLPHPEGKRLPDTREVGEWWTPLDTRRLMAEFVGTFFLVFLLAGYKAVIDSTDGVLSREGMAIGTGLVLLALIFTFGPLSGAHFNPAISVSLWLMGYFQWWRVPLYWFVQLAGAFLAGLIVWGFWGDHFDTGSNYPERGWSNGKAFLLEFALTGFLCVVVIHVASQGKIMGIHAALAVAATYAAALFLAGPWGGGSMNPARSLGVAVYGEKTHLVWIYIIGPLAGALAAVGVCRLLIAHTGNIPAAAAGYSFDPITNKLSRQEPIEMQPQIHPLIGGEQAVPPAPPMAQPVAP